MNLASKLSARWARIYQQLIDRFACLQADLINMDDSIFIVKTYEEGRILFDEYMKISSFLNIKINNKKSYIIPINRSFIYCKWKYKLYETGKIICKPCINTIKRQNLKLKKMIKLNLSMEEIENTKRGFNTDLSLSII